jgi:hypothetical protein
MLVTLRAEDGINISIFKVTVAYYYYCCSYYYYYYYYYYCYYYKGRDSFWLRAG